MLRIIIKYIRQKPVNIFLYPSILLLFATSILLALQMGDRAQVTAKLSFWGLMISIIIKTIEIKRGFIRK